MAAPCTAARHAIFPRKPSGFSVRRPLCFTFPPAASREEAGLYAAHAAEPLECAATPPGVERVGRPGPAQNCIPLQPEDLLPAAVPDAAALLELLVCLAPSASPLHSRLAIRGNTFSAGGRITHCHSG